MQENQRQNDRIPVSLGVILDSSSGTREARISDVSMTGCFIDSIAKVGEGETLTFNLNRSTGQSVKLCGEVAYVYPGIGFGLRFINLTKAEQGLLKQIILEHGGQVSEHSYSAVEDKTKSGQDALEQEKSLPNTEKASFSELTRSIQKELDDGESQNR